MTQFNLSTRDSYSVPVLFIPLDRQQSTEAQKVIQLGLSSITGILEHKLCLFEIELQSKKNCFWWFSQHFLKFLAFEISKVAKYYLYNEMISLITLKACFDTVSLLRQDFARYSHYHLTVEWSKAKLKLRRLGLPILSFRYQPFSWSDINLRTILKLQKKIQDSEFEIKSWIRNKVINLIKRAKMNRLQLEICTVAWCVMRLIWDLWCESWL